MQELTELVTLFRKEAGALGTMRAAVLEPGSKTEQLFDAVLSGKVTSDESAMVIVYNATDDAKAKYYQLKTRLKEKLIQGILLTDLSGPESTDRHQAQAECQKKWAAALTLFSKGADLAAAELGEQILKKAKKFAFTELTLSISHRLAHHYAMQFGQAARYSECKALHRSHQELWVAEKNAEDLVNDIAATYKPTTDTRLELAMMAERGYEKIAPLLHQFDSYSLHLSGRILLLNSKMYRGDYESAIAVCKDAIRFFEKRKYNCNVPSQLFNYQLIVCQIQLKQFEEGRNTIRHQQAAFDEGSWNWFKFQELLFLLSMHTGHYDHAFQLQQKALQQPKLSKMPEMLQESWKIYEGFVWFLVKAGKVKASGGKSAFKTGKFLNEVPQFSKDKRSTNVPVLILQLLHALADGKRDALLDRSEALAKYSSRYLKDDNQFRSNCFIQLLLQIPAGQFHPVAVGRKAEKWVARLAERPVQIADQPFELEIIPYETLWNLTITLLH